MAKVDQFGFMYYRRFPKHWKARGKLIVAEYCLEKYIVMDDNEFNRKCFGDQTVKDKIETIRWEIRD